MPKVSSNEEPRPKALVVDDDDASRQALVAVIEREGFDTVSADSLATARASLEDSTPDLILVDMQLPDGSGLDLLGAYGAAPDGRAPDMVVITGHSSVETAVDALRRGAVDYLTKPLDVARLRAVLLQTTGRLRYRNEIRDLRGRLRELGRFGSMVGSAPAMQKLFDQITRVAPTDASVLILGESGTGKELVAETVHELSRRRDRPLVSINCGAISATLIESELFGHERGSFTGADRMHRGHFERADGGTLFLDEVSEMPLELQVKLLRVLESGSFSRVGGDRPLKVDVRIVAASNRDLEAHAADGKFRADLLYRLKVFPLQLPPLRDRPGDLALLAEHFLALLNRADGSEKSLARTAMERLRTHDWPGNVRELKHVLQRAFILSDGEIGHDAFSDLPVKSGAVTNGATLSGAPGKRTVTLEPGVSLADAEKQLVLATLEHVGGDKTKASEILGISTKTLYSRLREYQAAKS
jgi:two-component system response regulator AtoC